MGPEEHGGHCELVFDDMELDDDRVLMGDGKGLKVTQIRLGLARPRLGENGSITRPPAIVRCADWSRSTKRSP